MNRFAEFVPQGSPKLKRIHQEMIDQPFSQQIEEFVLNSLDPRILSQHKILLAISGGADSTALARVVHQIAGHTDIGPVSVAHVNHELRGKDSEQDHAFVQNLAKQLQFEFHSTRLPLARSSNGLESDLRDLRYQYLFQLAGQIGARYLFTGHHRNDQTETILFRMIRGTGINGLTGIPKMRKHNDHLTIVRPLLSVSRQTIVDYLAEIGQPFRVDQSNNQMDFARNKIRNEILPTVYRSFDWDIHLNLERLSQQANEWVDFLNSMASPILDECCHIEPNRATFQLSDLIDRHPVLIRQIMLLLWQKMNWPQQDMNRDKWFEIENAILHPSKPCTQQKRQHLKKMLPGKIECFVSEKTIQLTRIIDR